MPRLPGEQYGQADPAGAQGQTNGHRIAPSHRAHHVRGYGLPFPAWSLARLAGFPVTEGACRGNHHHLVCRSCGAVRDVDCVAGIRPAWIRWTTPVTWSTRPMSRSGDCARSAVREAG